MILKAAKSFFHNLLFSSGEGRTTLFKAIWLCLVISSSLICVWFLGNLSNEFYKYYRCNKKITGTISKWEVTKKGSDNFILVAHFQYKQNDQIYLGLQEFEQPVFRHPFAAESTIAKNKEKTWPVWVCKTKPHIATLQRTFSIKILIQTILSIGVLIYFIWLREYLLVLIPTEKPTQGISQT
ncbi:MAG: hypothetical protein P0S95_03040 [Rhabdochlamydiaceae bacterium]|nr:hypothetical protein [Candidatus Amphrikana amoebophyrae]